MRPNLDRPSAPASTGPAALPATILAACAYAAAVVYQSWPLLVAPGTALVDPRALGGPGSVWAQADLDLLVWILAWTSHALVAQPLELFQANIFHPARDALASSEHLIGLAPIAAPLFWASGNAILTYNLTVVAVIWLSALCTFVLVRSWTGSNAAAFLAGVTFGLGPQLVSSWIRLHSSAVHLFPLVLLLAVRTARDPRPRTLALLALVTALQALAGVYVAFELVMLLAAFLPAIWLEARRSGRSVLPTLGALTVGGAALLPTAFPYLRIRDAGLLPTLEQARELITSASPSLPVFRHLIGSHTTWPVLLLAVLGLVWSRRVAWHLRLGLLLIGVVGAIFTAGTTLPLIPGTGLASAYELAMRFVPGFAGMRAPMRFVVLPLLAISVLVGIGAAQLVELARSRTRQAAGLATAVVLLASLVLIVVREPRGPWPVAAAALSGPLGNADRWLRDHGGGGAVLQLPAVNSVMDGRAMLATGRYMVGSTLHWLPLVNGYSGHPPASNRLLMTLAQRLPDADALDTLCSLAHPRWIVVHFGQMAPGEEGRWTATQAAAGLEPVARFGKTVVYEVKRACTSRADALLRQLAGANDVDRTLDGAPLYALSNEGARGSISGELPATLAAGTHATLWLTVHNGGSAVWPGLSIAPRGTVEIEGRWRDARDADVVQVGEPLPLGRDLGPGETMLAQVNVLAPTAPGDYVLEVALKQSGHGWLAELSDEAAALRAKVVVTGNGRATPPAADP